MRLLVNFSKKKGTAPIIAQAVKDTGVLINVERAVIDSSEGEALIEVPDDQCKLIRSTMTRLGATVRQLEHGIGVDQSECVDCGACISVCPREVFSFDADFKLVVAEDKCVLCGKCIPACPHKALTLPV
jgi:NAD-dependent dihydropyrimidine dehydrogenase PreA subunit